MGQSQCLGGPQAGAAIGAIPVIVSLRKLRKATNEFNPDLQVGQGGSGYVYRGTLKSGQVVAVKRLKASATRDADYNHEIGLVPYLSHPNIINLVCCCAHEDRERIIVYDFMPMRTLYHHLHARQAGEDVLNWNTRMRIAAGVAKGLSYLHNEANPRVIFGDLRPSKVLLGLGYQPRIFDFRLAVTEPSHGQPSTVAATENEDINPYRAPEARLSPKSDVYSFGVLLMEIISGTLNLDRYNPQHIADWVLDRKNFGTMADRAINEHVPNLEVVKAMTIAVKCIRIVPFFRPDMSDVVIGMRNLAGEPNVEWPEQQFNVMEEQPESSNRNRSNSHNRYRSVLMNPNMLPRI